MPEKKDIIDSRNLMMISVITMLLLATLITIGMMTPLIIRLTSGAQIGMSAEYFNQRSALPVAALVILLTACLLNGYFGSRRTAYVAGTTLLIALIFAFISPFGNLPLDITVPIVSMGIVATLYKIYISLSTKERNAKIRKISAHVIHLGILLILIGIVASSNLKVDGSYVISTSSPG